MEHCKVKLKILAKVFLILSDHKNLEYFMSSRKLTERQVRWSGTLSEFNFQLWFKAEKKSQKLDALSRRDRDMLNGEDDERLKNYIT